MNLVDLIIYVQSRIIPQVTGSLIHEKLWVTTVFVDHHLHDLYANLVRGASYMEAIQPKESYKPLAFTNGRHS